MDLRRLDERVRGASGAGEFHAAAIAVVSGGRPLFARGYGDGIDARTRFPIGSITKLLTALCVLRLADAGRLALDTPIVEQLPRLAFDDAKRGSRVTLRHLLTHTSGLPPAGRDWGPPNPGALARFAVEDLAHHEFLADPGSVAAYSSTALSLAGLAVEGVCGSSFPVAVAELVAAPTAAEVVFPEGDASPSALAWPHERRAGRCVPAARLADNPAGYPSAFVLASAESLANVAASLVSGRPVALEQLVERVASRHVDAAPYPLARASAAFGLGCFTGRYAGRTVVRHGGVTQGGQCSLDLFPEDERALVLLTTGADDEAFGRLLGDLYHVVLECEPDEGREPDAAAPADVQRVRGTYVDPATGGRVELDSGPDGAGVLRRGAKSTPLLAASERDLLAREDTWTPVWAPEGDPPQYVVVWGAPHFRTEPEPWADAPSEFAGAYRDAFWPDLDSDFALRARSGRWSATGADWEAEYEPVGPRRLLGAHGLIDLAPDAASLRLGRATRYVRAYSAKRDNP